MKTAILGPICYLLFVCSALYSCELLYRDETKIFIAGTYTRHYKDEYTDSYDTIFIKSIAGDNYRVTKRSIYQKMNDDQTWKSGSEDKHWTGNYDKGTHSLFLSPPGKTIFFDLEKQELKIGTEPYKKES